MPRGFFVPYPQNTFKIIWKIKIYPRTFGIPKRKNAPLTPTTMTSRAAQVIALLRKLRTTNRIVLSAKAVCHSLDNDSKLYSSSLRALGRDAQQEAEGTRYVDGKGLRPRVTDANELAELRAVSLLGAACGFGATSCPETFRETLSDACVLIDSTTLNEQPR